MMRESKIEPLDVTIAIILHGEPPEQMRRCVHLYRDLIHGRISGREVWTALRAVNRAGVTRGTLEQRRDPLAIL